MTKTLKERKRELAMREEALKEELDLNSDGLKEKAKHVGKIALVSGGVALLGFWIYKAFFEEESDEKPSKKSKKRKKATKDLTSKLSAMAMPYLGKVLDSFLNENKEEVSKEEVKREERNT